MTASTAAAGPVGTGDRVEIVDVLRGFAVCGILFVNIMWFKAPGSLALFGSEGNLLDQLAGAAVIALAQAKFFPLFALLFGWGFAMQLRRAQWPVAPPPEPPAQHPVAQAGEPRAERPAKRPAEQQEQAAGFSRRFLRRLLVLGLIGMIHIALLSQGDVLLPYAAFGLLLLPLQRARPETLVRWVIWLLAVPAAVWLLLFGALALGRAVPEAAVEIEQADQELREEFLESAQATTAAYLDPAFAREAATRIRLYGGNVPFLLMQGPTILAMFLLGLLVARRDLARRVADHQVLLRRVRAWCLGLGLPLALLMAVGITQLPTLSAVMVFSFNAALAGPILMLGYCAGIALLWQRSAWQRLLRPLAALGRLALTNYLLQSLIATLLFYGYGLGLARRVSPALALLIAIAILAAQLLISTHWLRRYRIGPAEWLWRTLTYGHPQPFRRAPH